MERALELFNLENAQIIKRGDGDISSGVIVRNEKNDFYYVKFNFGETISASMFKGEQAGLESMRKTNCGLIIPAPIKVHRNGMMMEYLEFWSVVRT